ncbi:hypothetical protein HBI55_075950 [Parastagonospora nodorum]|nr:hypothetical protein HBH82_244720 [Parastagonospora nodorum]KAH4686508.1 hypothetical protein HBH78_105130 [Parastagonospora nodorum]KAH4704038.1 hypothetical protein HBH67_110050 [Parastagonospora nodorum]KAH4773111.1 hypothetical protein HBH62_196730 [Parastagonospora nodorum]KAH4781533.1 hypothetical protein HBH63_126740 [Parastagonospora nodorum]
MSLEDVTCRFTSRWHIEVSKKENSHEYPSEQSFIVATSSTTRDNATSTPKLLQLTIDLVHNCQWVCRSMPSKTGTTSAAGGSLATIAELVELIILNLGYHDILRVCLVSRFWCAIIRNSQKLQRVLHKLPTPTGVDLNPHFEPGSVESRNSLVPQEVHAGQPILNLCKQLTEYFLEEMRPETSHAMLAECYKRYNNKRFRYRFSCRNIRRPDGWPGGFKEIFCYICECFHTQFKFENLHPLLAGLEDVQICFRGQVSHILFTANTRYDPKLPRSCFDRIIADFRELATLLTNARDIMNHNQLHNDLLTRPLSTRLVSATGLNIAENMCGITLGEAIPLLIKALSTALERRQRSLVAQVAEMVRTDFSPSFESAYQMQTFSMQPVHYAAFPTEADWNDHKADFPNILSMFKDAVRETGLVKDAAEMEHDPVQ